MLSLLFPARSFSRPIKCDSWYWASQRPSQHHLKFHYSTSQIKRERNIRWQGFGPEGEEKGRVKEERSKYKKNNESISRNFISSYKVVFPVTVLSLVVNISSQSKHIEGRGTERLEHSPNTLDLITDASYAAEAFCSSFNSFICFMQVFKIFLTLFLMNPVHQISFFFFKLFLCTKKNT